MSPAAPAARRVIIDTDPSAGVPGADIDDVLALACALGDPAIRVEGITVVAGNVELPDALASALQALEAFGRPDIPVHAGAARALVRDRAEIVALLRGRGDDPLVRELWRDVPRPASARGPVSGRAAEFIVETALAAPGEITLVTVGPLTNVATALLLQPRVATHVREIVFMGGNVRGSEGGISPIEFNVANDPEAAHVVFCSGAPLVMVGLDVTTRTHFTLEALETATAAGTPAARFLRRITEPWIRFVQARRGSPGCWLHDPLAVVAAADRTVVATERMEVGVELRGKATYGLTIAQRPGAGSGGRQLRSGPVDVAVSVDNARFMDRFLPALTRAVSTPG